MQNLKIKITPEDVLKGKFYESLSLINGFLTEADNEDDNYTSTNVFNRLMEIREAMLTDIKRTANDITLYGEE
jgi:hypothetical protein